jgi:hypothetical protein
MGMLKDTCRRLLEGGCRVFGSRMGRPRVFGVDRCGGSCQGGGGGQGGRVERYVFFVYGTWTRRRFPRVKKGDGKVMGNWAGDVVVIGLCSYHSVAYIHPLVLFLGFSDYNRSLIHA